MNKPYTVVCTIVCGMIGVDYDVSKHATTKAAFRALHKYAKKFPDRYYRVENNEGEEMLETKKYVNGRWVTL